MSRSGSVKKFEFLRPFSKATGKLKKSCIALDQLYIELKMKCFFTTIICLSKSNVDNFLRDLDINHLSIF